MSVPGRELARLLELAGTSAATLRAAGIEQQVLGHGWLVIQRLDRRVIVHDPGGGGTPRRQETFYEQIWLTPGGELQTARRAHTAHRESAPGGDVVDDRDVTLPGGAISSLEDCGSRWDGDYGPTSRHSAGVETIEHDKPVGARRDPATRIAAALENMTAHLLEGDGPPPEAKLGLLPTIVLAVGGGMMLVAGSLLFMLVLAVGLYMWFMGVAAGG